MNNPIQQNSLSNIVLLRAFDTTNGRLRTGLSSSTTNLQIVVSVNNGAWTNAGTLTTMVEGTFASLGFVECANSPGTYQFGLPNPFTTTLGSVKISGRVIADPTVLFTVENIPVVGYDAVADNTTELASSTVNALLNWEPYTGYSLARLLRVLGIVLRGTVSGGRTGTETFTAPAGGATVTATTDANGNRTVVNDTASGTP